MRGAESGQQVLFSYVAIDARIPADHPLRAMKQLLEPVLADLAPRFATMYADGGRPSIPPEQLLRALLLQVLYTIRSERQLMEQLEYNLLFRWFVGLGMDDAVWHPTTFTKNRDRMLAGSVAEAFFAAVVRQADGRGLLSREHFTVDGTLLEAWASQKSVRPKADAGAPPNDGPPAGGAVGRNTPANFHGEQRANTTHQSVTDPDARLARKGPGKPSVLAYQASVLTDNRHGFVVATAVGLATGTAEVEQAEQMLGALSAEPAGRTGRRTVGADKLYDQRGFVAAARALAYVPHVARQRHADSPQPDRRAHDPPRRLCGESAAPQAGRGELRVGESGGAAAQTAPPRGRAGRLGLHVYDGRLQPGAVAHADRRRSRSVTTPRRDLTRRPPRARYANRRSRAAETSHFNHFSASC